MPPTLLFVRPASQDPGPACRRQHEIITPANLAGVASFPEKPRQGSDSGQEDADVTSKG